MAVWERLSEFPDYSVSTEGNIRNDATGRILKHGYNKKDVAYVGLYKDGAQLTRGVAKLVAQTFVPMPKGSEEWDLPTPIHRNGDSKDCSAANLMWRPRWFAYEYAMQMKNGVRNVAPIRDVNTGEVFSDVMDIITTYGVLFRDIMASVHEGYPVMPIRKRFEWLD